MTTYVFLTLFLVCSLQYVLDHIALTARDIALTTPLSSFNLPDPQQEQKQYKQRIGAEKRYNRKQIEKQQSNERAAGKLMSLVEKGLDESAAVATGKYNSVWA